MFCQFFLSGRTYILYCIVLDLSWQFVSKKPCLGIRLGKQQEQKGKYTIVFSFVIPVCTEASPQKKDKCRREGKCRPFYLEGGKNLFNSLPRQLFSTGRFELKKEFPQDDLKEKDEFILFFKIVLGKIASAASN